MRTFGWIVIAALVGLTIAGAWIGVVLATAPAHAQARSVIEAIIHVESGGRAHVTGRAGEIGLMQIKCRTARGIGFRGNCRDLYNPGVNRRWGTAYFHAGLKRAGGNLHTAISRYQRGIYSNYRGCSAYCQRVLRAMR